MAKFIYGVSPTSVVLRVKMLDNSVTTGAGKTGLVYNSLTLKISTIKIGDASATVYSTAGNTIETITTLGTYAAPTATKCRFKEVDVTNHPGVYEIQFADARFATTDSLLVSIQHDNAAQCDFEIECRNLAANAIQIDGVANSTHASGMYPSDVRDIVGAAVNTGTAQLGVNVVSLAADSIDASVIANNAIDATAIASNAITAAKIASDAITAAKIADGAIDAATFATAAITADAIATDAIDAAAVKADAVTKIQNGLATPTNITAGTITTVTNLTNAPTAGDFTATMKTSIATADQSAMTSQGYTTTRAGYLDTLNGLVAAIWAAATSGMSTVGSIGKKLADWVVGTITANQSVNVAQWGGNNIATPAISGEPVVTLAATQAAYAPAKAGDAMLVTAGTGTGQLDITSGVIKSNLVQILGTALTETAGYLAAGFKKFFNVLTPVATVESVNQTGDSYNVVKSGGAGDAAAIKTKTDQLIFTSESGTTNVNAHVKVSDVSGGLTAQQTRDAMTLSLTATPQEDSIDDKLGVLQSDVSIISAEVGGIIDGSNVVKADANLVSILGTVLTETAGNIAAAFKKFFNIDTPVATVASVNQTGDGYAIVNNGAYGNSALNTAIGTRLPTSGYTAPDNAGITAIKAKTDQLIFTGSYVNAEVKNIDTGAISAAAVSAAAVTKIQTGLANSSDMTTINGKLDTIYTTEGTIISDIGSMTYNVATIVERLPVSGNISNLALTDSIDGGVSMGEVLSGVLAMTSGRFKKDYPASGQVTFYKRDNATPAFVVSVNDTERTRE